MDRPSLVRFTDCLPAAVTDGGRSGSAQRQLEWAELLAADASDSYALSKMCPRPPADAGLMRLAVPELHYPVSLFPLDLFRRGLAVPSAHRQRMPQLYAEGPVLCGVPRWDVIIHVGRLNNIL